MRGRLVEYATLKWVQENCDGDASQAVLPHSVQYDDIYFAQRGVEETKHVFLDGNTLSERFSKAQRFSVAETGFGTGLNILSAWKLWEETQKPDNAKLHFLSFEKHPLHPNDLEKAHANWTELESYCKTLRDQWPAPITGFHHLELSPNVTLTLYYGDIKDGMEQSKSLCSSIDAWFLDGFSPSKNSAMWCEDVFQGMAAISKPGASFATFTVAGDVRRGLSAAGFEIAKKPGFGRKRDMLTGIFRAQDEDLKSDAAPWYSINTVPPLKMSNRIAIIGAGISGASLAHALTRHGFEPVIFEKEKPGAGASGNMAGLIMPRLDRDTTPAAEFSVHAWLFTLRLLQRLQASNPDIALFNPCGAARLANERESREQIQTFTDEYLLPEGWIQHHENGIVFPMGGVISPPDYVRLLLADTPILIEKVLKIEQSGSGISIKTNKGTHRADRVIFANGFDALSSLQSRGLPLMASLGQIDVFPNARSPVEAFSHGPYAAPLSDSTKKIGTVIGATYRPHERGEKNYAPTQKATAENIRKLRQYRPDITDTLDSDDVISRASLRCMTPDQLPVAGPLPDWGFYAGAYDGLRTGRIEVYPAAQYQDNVYILSGLGSRGLVTAPLAATMVASQIAGTPPPVSREIYDALHPGRFFIRDLKRTKARPTKS